METKAGNALKVLIISSDPSTATSIKGILAGFGHKDVSILDNGIIALKSLSEKPQDFVICDMNMKFIQGWLFVKEIKTSEKIPNLPVMLIGEVPCPATEDELKQYGIVRYMKAPYQQGDLSFLINSTLQLFKTSGTIENKYTKAKSALMSKKSEEAVEIYQELRGLTKNSARSSFGLATAHIQKNDMTKAEEAMVTMADKEDSTPGTLVLRAEILLKRDREKDAKALVDTLLTKLMPGAPFYYSRCVKLFLDHKKLQSAEEICEIAIKKQFKIPDFPLTLARCKFQKAEFQKSIEIIATAEQHIGKSNEFLNLKGVCFKKLGRFSKAMEAYEEALRISPMDAKIYFNMASCTIAMKEYEKARSNLETCVKINPSFPRANEKLEELRNFLKAGKPAKGISLD